MLLPILGVVAFMAALIVSLNRGRTPKAKTQPERPTEFAPPINGDSRLPQGALFLPDYDA